MSGTADRRMPIADHETEMPPRIASFLLGLLLLGRLCGAASQDPPRLTIIHFDVNEADATLLISPDGRGVLIDAGAQGNGLHPILEFLNRARHDSQLSTLDYTIVTHYDEEHLGGMDELYRNGWYPKIAAYDRGNSDLPPFDLRWTRRCPEVDPEQARKIAPWGGAPERWCPRPARAAHCGTLQYFLAAEAGGRRKELRAGDSLELDHGLRIETLVANAQDRDGDSVAVFYDGRRFDCGQDDLSIGLLVRFGNFRYLTAGDLTGDPQARVAPVEDLIRDDARDVDVYHVNGGGDWTGSSIRFMRAIHPRVAIVSNGGTRQHPIGQVIDKRIRSLQPPPDVFLTNYNPQERAWKAPPETIADIDPAGFDGTIEIDVWTDSYRIVRWRNGNRIDRPGRRYPIKPR